MYHKLTIEETLKALDVDRENGLSYDEAASRGESPEQRNEGPSFFRLAAAGLSRPGVWLLIIAALLTLVLEGLVPSLLILSVIIINLILYSELKRRGLKTIDSSIRPTVTHAIVLRNGAKLRLSSDELVVGDIVSLKPGRVVPADLRLISSEDLFIDETPLTGVSEVGKDAFSTVPSDVGPERRINCAFEGTIVLRGRGEGVVISTGMSTEMSRLSLPLDKPRREEAPILSQINKTYAKVTLAAGLICLFIFIAGLLFETGLLKSTVCCIALAVAVVPEGLYLSALSALANGATRLTGAGFSLKRIDSVDSLGNVSAYITDIPKLGVCATYTNGRIKAPHEEDTPPLIDGLLLCELDNPSLPAFAALRCDENEIRSSFPKIGELSGEVTTTLHKAGKTTISYTGGDASEILERSSLIWDFGKIRTLTDSDREDIRNCLSSFENDGFVTTAIGMRSGDELPCDTSLVFVGLVATTAEPDSATTPDVATLSRLGIDVYLLTSEDAGRARLGAEALSLSQSNILCGRDVKHMSDSALLRALSDTRIFAGLSPSDKVRIVHALQGRGKTVCAKGGGLSDAGLLDCADVGISDIRAEDAAKGASDILCSEKSGADRAVILGAVTRENISRAVTYLICANLAELVCVGLSVICGFGYPMTPFQMLFVNLITDIFPAMTLATAESRRLRQNKTTLYLLSALFGVISMAVHVFISSTPVISGLSGRICALLLIFLELILLIPCHLSGRIKNDI